MARFSDIILALVDKVAEVVVDENAIIVTARQELPALVGDYDVCLRIRAFRDTEGTTAASGRHALLLRRYVDIIIRARQNSDISRQDLSWLTDETNGILDLEAQLLDLLEMWFPVVGQTSDGNSPISGDTPTALLVEPARIVSSEDALRDITRGRAIVNNDPGFGILALRLDLYYEQTLRQDIQ